MTDYNILIRICYYNVITTNWFWIQNITIIIIFVMLSKITRTEPLKPVTGSNKQFFDINRKKLSCFVKKDKKTVGLKPGERHQDPP